MDKIDIENITKIMLDNFLEHYNHLFSFQGKIKIVNNGSFRDESCVYFNYQDLYYAVVIYYHRNFLYLDIYYHNDRFDLNNFVPKNQKFYFKFLQYEHDSLKEIGFWQSVVKKINSQKEKAAKKIERYKSEKELKKKHKTGFSELLVTGNKITVHIKTIPLEQRAELMAELQTVIEKYKGQK